MKKNLFALLASLAMVISMIPLSPVMVSAYTADFTLYYDSTNGTMHKNSIGGEAVTATEMPGWSGSRSTLTLNGLNFTTTEGTALVVPAGTTIEVIRDNEIKTTPDNDTISRSYGIEVNGQGNLTFTGSGNLTASAGNSENYSYGIYNDHGALSFNGPGTITAIGGETTHGSYGIFSGTDSITVSGGEVIATGGTAKYESSGIRASKNVDVSGGKVIATGGTATYNRYSRSSGIQAKKFIFDGGTLNATGGTTGSTTGNQNLNSVGIFCTIFEINATSYVSSADEETDLININQIGLTAKGYTVALYSKKNDMSDNQGANIKDGVYAVGSANYDGSKSEKYVKVNNGNYKYVATKVKEESPAISPGEEDSKPLREEASDSSAETGDSTNLVFPIGIAIAALLVAAAVMFGRRRFNK